MKAASICGFVAVALMAVGCAGEQKATPAFNTGAMVRYVNLAGSKAEVSFGNIAPAVCAEWERTGFSRYRPKPLEVTVSRDGSTEKVNLDLKPSTRYTIYGVERPGGKIEHVTVEGDPKDAEESRVIFRAISFAGPDVDIVLKPTLGDPMEAKGLKSGQPSSNMTSTPQTFTVTAMSGGKPIGEQTIEAKNGETYTIAVTGEAKPGLRVILNNKKMLASPGGSSAAG